MSYREGTLVPEDFVLDPSMSVSPLVTLAGTESVGVQAVGHAVSRHGSVPPGIGLSRDDLTALGFAGELGQTLRIPRAGGRVIVAVGIGDAHSLSAAALRNASAAFARAALPAVRLAIDLPTAADRWDPEASVAAIVEGVVLARYRYDALKSNPVAVPVERLEILGSAHDGGDVAILHGLSLAHATMLARDLAAAPPAYLTATRFGEYAEAVAPGSGLEVDVFDRGRLIELGCGGLLGVNAGSVEEPRMIRLRYRPDGESRGRLALVGKGITYDSGGIALKPGDLMHLAMKMDMSGAAAVLAAMLALAELGCPNTVTAYLMCTDNMPSGSAMAMGEVLRIRGGTTVEVKNTDAEGRLVMADAIVLAVEDSADAIVDIATLTGAALVALGPLMAPVFGNDQSLLDQLVDASALTDETVWELPLDGRYRSQLDSDVADLSNLGGPYAGATTAALFLAHFAGAIPWAHIDIAGTMQSDRDDLWRSRGPTGFGARLLAEFASRFVPPSP